MFYYVLQSLIFIYDVIIIFLSSVSADGIRRSTEDLPSQISFALVNQTSRPPQEGSDNASENSLVPRLVVHAFHPDRSWAVAQNETGIVINELCI